MDVKIDCICASDGARRHPEGDTIVLRDRLDFKAATALRSSIGLLYAQEPDAGLEDVLAVLNEGYLIYGIESWTVERDGPRGKPEPVPLSRAEIRERLLWNIDTAMQVADVADGLYVGAVLDPLVKRAATSSPATPTESSTSRKSPTSPRPRKPSKQSSISTTRTDGIEMTSESLDGGSNSWPNSTSAH